MANREIRRSLLERLCRCAGRDWKFEKLFSLLQFRPAASGARQSNTSGGLLRNSEQERTLLSARRNKDAARHFLMSFEGMGKTIRTMEAPIQKADAPAHLSDEFPAGYSLTGCSPALPASASPAGAHLAGRRLRCTINFQRTANSVLTVCLSPGDNPKHCMIA